MKKGALNVFREFVAHNNSSKTLRLFHVNAAFFLKVRVRVHVWVRLKK